jgi:hypothetical protein
MFIVDPATDPLGVLTASRAVMERAAQVNINPEQVEAIASQLAATPSPAPEWDGDDDATAGLHFRDGTWRTAAWVLVLDALNFCFWAQGDDPDARWRVSFRNHVYDGYWALAATLTRAVEEGYPLWDAAYLAQISEADLAAILRPADAPATTHVPLLPERLANLRELGQGLLAGSSGTITDGGETAIRALLDEAGGSAARLVDLVVTRFPSFADVATYDDLRVPLYKRAQILVSDLHGAGAATFTDLDVLTAFADYKVPQVLRRFGILVYAPALAERIARRELIPAGSVPEVEIRAATVWACELLRRAVAARGATLRAFEIDWALWSIGQSLPPGTEPYHRTRTIFY